ncbi:hypothetical protein J7376_11185 [Paracoccus sp. R12_1]|uniref:hypothetical protein n=1 Tax=unclassified Paracoccus (in: a-proteobacteria) TaxID=2688777 RepID=UPI001ADB2888|nr:MULTISPECIES: hypothetical protein [unclassified Paracoccus (in: a-proteobacteria)]MBO9456098.1 hypothetical protein [Paracoccus sp. R12_2]MBO9487085.1 hypothetical protein [Paracoccus sp. R12_1]
MAVLRYLSHPQVLIDPAVPVPRWSLSDHGRSRMPALSPLHGWRLAEAVADPDSRC